MLCCRAGPAEGLGGAVELRGDDFTSLDHPVAPAGHLGVVLEDSVRGALTKRQT